MEKHISRAFCLKKSWVRYRAVLEKRPEYPSDVGFDIQQKSMVDLVRSSHFSGISRKFLYVQWEPW